MDLEKLREKLEKLAELECKDQPNEEATKYRLVLPFLKALGWEDSDLLLEDFVDESRKRSDVCLYCGEAKNSKKIVIEAKHCRDVKLANAEEQIAGYWSENTVMAIITNGYKWHFFKKDERSSKIQKIFNYFLPNPIFWNEEKLNLLCQLLLREKVKSNNYLSLLEETAIKARPQNERIEKGLLVPLSEEGSFENKVPFGIKLQGKMFDTSDWKEAFFRFLKHISKSNGVSMSEIFALLALRNQQAAGDLREKGEYLPSISRQRTRNYTYVSGASIYINLAVNAEAKASNMRYICNLYGIDPQEILIGLR